METIKSINLTSVKHAEFASEETECFEAVVLLDGKRALTVRNDGKGGCNWYRDLIPGSEARLHEYAKTLPEIVTDMKDPLDKSGVFKYPQSADTIIGDLLDDHLKRRDMKRALARCVHFKTTDREGVWALAKTKWTPANQDIIRNHLEKKYPGVVILNALPEDEAIKLWGDN